MNGLLKLDDSPADDEQKDHRKGIAKKVSDRGRQHVLWSLIDDAKQETVYKNRKQIHDDNNQYPWSEVKRGKHNGW